MDNLPVLILVGLFALGKWLLTKANGASPSDSAGGVQPPQPGPQARQRPQGTETDEERMRRFMDALGLPAQGAPPAKVLPRPEMQSPPPLISSVETVRRPNLPELPKVRPARRGEGRPVRRAEHKGIAPELAPMTAMDPIAKVASVSETAPSMEVTSIPAMDFGSPVEDAENAVSAAGRVDRPQSQPAAAQRSGIPFRGQLRGGAALRKALVLREILGPPKALQSKNSSSSLSPL